MIHPRTLDSLEFGKIVEELAALCLSDPGRKMARAIAPLPSRAEAEAAFALYEETALWAAQNPQFAPGPFPDTSGMTALVKRKSGPTGLPASFYLDPDSLWALRNVLRLGNEALSTMAQGGNAWPKLLANVGERPVPQELLAALNRCISDDSLLKDESSPELYSIRTELRRLHQDCLRKVRALAEKYNMLPYLQDEFMTLASDRYVLPLKANFKGKMQGIIHDWSQTGETCYFEPYFLVEINNRLQELKHEEREAEREILRYLTGLVERNIDGVEALASFLAWLDTMQATRKLADKLDARCITFTGTDAGMEMLAARHPLLVLSREGVANAARVHPLDIILRPGERALIITGGNAGGKTVCLKTLGLLSAMAMSGLPVPCAPGSHLPWYGRIDAFIGDEQSISENMSTFSAQIDHLAKAFKYLDDSALALLDEFGAGTDPAEGAALAQGLHDELLARKCHVLSATHFPALKAYALSTGGARAASMLFDPQTSKPLFKLAYDQVGSSQALAVAAEHGLPESILARAKHYLLQDGADATATLEHLNALAVKRDEEIASLKRERAEGARQLEKKKEGIERERARLRSEIEERMATLMAAWKTEKTTARQTMREMSGIRAELGLEERQSILPAPESWAIGQKIFHTGFRKSGLITELDTKKGKAKIDLNGVGIWASFKDLRQSAEPARKSAAVGGGVSTNTGPLFNLDVRGLRADEALAEVEKFLDRAILAGSGEVEIVHGRGTGALRREIHAFLRSSPAVDSMSLAPEDRGGNGMTIVKLR